MANDKRRKEDKRRAQEDQAIVEALRQGGRTAVVRFRDGSVRTTVWLNRNDRSVPAMVEQFRFYSTGAKPGLSRFLEASDLVHSLRSLQRVETFLNPLPETLGKPPELPEEVVREAIDRGAAPVHEAFVHGNVAANWFVNPVEYEIETGPRKGEILVIDAVTKVEPLAVNKPGVAIPFFQAGQLPEMRQCLLDVIAGLEPLYQKIEMDGHLGPKKKAPTAA
jgi:hypothetical protein